jgi:hypothetical protein
MFSTKRSLCGAIVLLSPAAAFAQRGAPPNNIVVDVTPSHAVSSFSPFRSLGAGIDRLRGDTTDKVMTPDFIAQIQSAGWQTVSYRQNTELFAEAWHWNPNGKWSNPGAKEGYFVGDATPTEPIRHSWAAPLPHRGFTMGDGTGYSRLTDGDPGTYWKSNPYLTKAFTGEAGHPQWVTLDLGGKLEIDAIRIAWAAPFATRYRVQYWTGGHDPFGAPADGIWQTFPPSASCFPDRCQLRWPEIWVALRLPHRCPACWLSHDSWPSCYPPFEHDSPGRPTLGFWSRGELQEPRQCLIAFLEPC